MAKKTSTLKTVENKSSVAGFLNAIADPQRRKDSKAVAAMMESVSKAKPKMWGTSIVGFGDHHYKYESGREGDWFLAGFSPRKDQLTLYLSSGFDGRDSILKRLGRYRTGKSCLYLKKLSDVDLDVLKELVENSVAKRT